MICDESCIFKNQTYLCQVDRRGGEVDDAPAVPENWTRAPGSRHAPFLRVATLGTPSGIVLVSPFTFFRVPEGERSVLSAAQIKFVTLVVRRVQRAPLGPDLLT